MVKKCLFKQKIQPQVQKLREFFVISNQNAQFITDFFVLITWVGPTTSTVFFIGDPSLVGEPPSGVRNLVSFQIFITNYHSNKRKVRLLLANLKVPLNKFSYRFPVRPYWLINFFKETCRGARWLSGSVSDSGARGRGFETYRRRVVSSSKTLYSPKVLVNYPGSGGSVPTWLKNCWLGR